MADSIFLEIVIPQGLVPFQRHMIEDALEQAFDDERLGEMMGGGGADNACDIAVQVNDLEHGLEVIRRVLKEAAVPSDTIINQYEPKKAVYRL